ncbi:MAG: hypothetical protein ACRELD_08145 [Longimicrobiales bacterium]
MNHERGWERGRRWRWALGLGLALSGCAPAVGPELIAGLRVSARQALGEALTVARTWSPAAELRWLEGWQVSSNGYVLSGDDARWDFVFEAPGQEQQLVVTVTPRSLDSVRRARQSPTGFVIGTNRLPGDWVDSPAVMQEVLEAEPGVAAAGVELLLVPLQRPQWIIRTELNGRDLEWRVDAGTGERIAQRSPPDEARAAARTP